MVDKKVLESDKKVLESDSQVMAAKSTSEQAVTASATTASVTSSSSTTAAMATGDQSSATPTVTVAPPDDGKKSPEPGSPDWVYADLPVPEVSFYYYPHTVSTSFPVYYTFYW